METDLLLEKFNKANQDEYLDKATTAAGLGILKSLLDTKIVKGGGPPYIKRQGKTWYNKLEALQWHQDYKSKPKRPFFLRPSKDFPVCDR